MRATLIVDGETRLDDELDEWHRRPPAVLADIVKPGVTPEPFLLYAGIELANATRKGQPIRVTIDTRADGWTLTVTQSHL